MADSTDEIRITLRLPVPLRDHLVDSARANSRSMNGEIVFRLEDYPRLAGELAKSQAELARREEQLFTDRVKLRNLLEEDGELARLRRDAKESRQQIEYLEEVRSKLEAQLEKAENGDFSYAELPKDKSLYVVIDFEGRPSSWQEIMAHLGEIGRAAGWDVDTIQARAVDAEMMRNDDREKAWWDLINYYRTTRNKRKAKP